MIENNVKHTNLSGNLWKQLCVSALLVGLLGCSSSKKTFEQKYPVCETTDCVPVEIPQLIIPHKDKKNHPIRMYRDEVAKDSIYEVSIVFLNERVPIPLVNKIYEWYRKQKYERKEDIESFYLEKNKHGEWNISFRGIYCEKHKWNALGKLHITKKIPYQPYIYSGAWNHSFNKAKHRKYQSDTVNIANLPGGNYRRAFLQLH